MSDVNIEEITAGDFDFEDNDNFFDLSDPIPEDTPDPVLYRMLLMPVSLPRVTKGGIILSDATLDADNWNNMLARVVKLGPLCFMHPRYLAMGLKEPPIKTGDLIMVTARVPFSWHYKGKRLIIVSDDQFFAIVSKEDTVQDFSFR